MVRIHPDPPHCLRWLVDEPLGIRCGWRYPCMTGGLAQLGEHLLCKQGVVGSIPSSSTNPQCAVFCEGTERFALAIEPVGVLRG